MVLKRAGRAVLWKSKGMTMAGMSERDAGRKLRKNKDRECSDRAEGRSHPPRALKREEDFG